MCVHFLQHSFFPINDLSITGYAFLACGLADGSIIVARVSQTLKLVQTVINVSDEDCISVVCTLMHKPREASYRRAIIISWVDTSLPRVSELNSISDRS